MKEEQSAADTAWCLQPAGALDLSQTDLTYRLTLQVCKLSITLEMSGLHRLVTNKGKLISTINLILNIN